MLPLFLLFRFLLRRFFLRASSKREMLSSPTFHVFREEVYLPMEGKMSLFSKQVRAPYRAGVRPEEWGPWQVVVRVQDPPEGLCGMGLVVAKNRD